MNTSNKPLFASILDEAPTEVVRPKPMPEGTYLWVVQSHRYDESTKKKTKYVEFTLACLQPFDDVDQAELEACGGAEGKERKLTFYLTPDAAFLLDAFHEDCGIDLSTPTSRRQRNELVQNAQVIGVLKQRVVEDESGDHTKDKVYADITQTARA